MKDYTSQKYDVVRNKIKELRNKNYDWEEIKVGRQKTAEKFNWFLEEFEILGFTNEDYLKIVDLQRKSELSEKSAIIKGDLELEDGIVNTLEIPSNFNSSWQLYKNKLRDKGFSYDSIEEIEITTNQILNLLNINSRNTKKGLVVGNVQSGKTSNMAALMAMAADHGWNMFIVLSGTIENLRKQTQERLLEDLKTSGNLTWFGLEHLSKDTSLDQKLQNLYLKDKNIRYFNVTLKNKSRLKKLFEWLNTDQNKKNNLKILLIDDEADQASINTGKNIEDERKAINKLILKIVNNENKKLKEEKPYGAMNYIAYTATPYANILNESREKSLFPRDFIVSLKTSNKYFGPQEIFGGINENENGLDIIREINNKDIKMIKEIHLNKNEYDELPESLKSSIYWFLCGVATMRYWKYNKPVSMLIHTSQNQKNHDNIFILIDKWLKNMTKDELLIETGKLWKKETNRFSKDHFYTQIPNYRSINDEEIRDYPKFEDIRDEILKIKERTTHIVLNQDQDLIYDEKGGVHICIDNCSKNKTEDGFHMRLAYPNKNDSINETTPAFIVIGGSTISRGLTLEGLISSYFLRSVKQADTLMQMGRWFGYRKNYELLPRIWLSDNTNEQFKFLSKLDEELRDSIKEMEVLQQKPLDYGVKISNSPSLNFIRITTKNKMQAAIEAEYDFSGLKNQTTYFVNDLNILKENKILGEKFINSLPIPKKIKNSMIWENVDFSIIEKFLLEYKFNERQKIFSKISLLIEWIWKNFKEDKLYNWDIILVGKEHNSNTSSWNLKHGKIAKVTRSRRKTLNDNIIDIGALFFTADLFINIDNNIILKYENSLKQKDVNKILEEANKEKTPQLFIYLIDKNSKRTGSNSNRKNLEAVEDILGITIVIPGSKISNSQVVKLTVNVEEIDIENDSELK